jgi:hypothetical protein
MSSGSDAAGRALFALYSETLSDRGEDAQPLLHVHPETGCVCLAVFDGMGGSGARAADGHGGRTDAYVASRLAREVITGAVAAEPVCRLSAEDLRLRVERSLREAFRLAAEQVETAPPRTRVVSKMAHTLPTTLAMAVVATAAPDVFVRAMWAGDSRIYALTPEQGLMQLTSDHLRRPRDAFEGLYDEQPLSNFLSGDGDFHIDAIERRFQGPVLVLAATDGCFGYWPSPMHLEEALLASMCDATSIDGWAHALRARIVAVAADDASLAVVAPLGTGLDELIGAFRGRLQRMRAEFLPGGDTDGVEVGRLRELWQRYRTGYETCVEQVDE